MSRRALILALIAFAGTVGGYMAARGWLPWIWGGAPH
jgi:hypothetical protein